MSDVKTFVLKAQGNLVGVAPKESKWGLTTLATVNESLLFQNTSEAGNSVYIVDLDNGNRQGFYVPKRGDHFPSGSEIMLVEATHKDGAVHYWALQAPSLL